MGDNLRRKKRVEDRKVITEQIDAIRRKRILEEEQREQESKAMLELIAKYEKEDVEAAAIQKVEQERARMEVMEANKASIERKHAEKQRDRDEEGLSCSIKLGRTSSCASANRRRR